MVVSSSVFSLEIVTSSSSGLILYSVFTSKIRVIPKMFKTYLERLMKDENFRKEFEKEYRKISDKEETIMAVRRGRGGTGRGLGRNKGGCSKGGPGYGKGGGRGNGTGRKG